MDKATVALSATEDNAAAIRELGRELKRRTTNKYIVGTRISSGISFGNIESDGTVFVIVMATGTTKRDVYYCDKLIWSSPLPAFLLLPKGSGELQARGTVSAAAVVFGAETQKNVIN